MKILAIVPYSPNSVRVRTLSNIHTLFKCGSVDLIILDDGGKIDSSISTARALIVDNASKIRRLFRCIKALLSLKPVTYYFYYTSKLKPVLASIDVNSYDAVFVERLPICDLDIKHANVIFDCVDCFSEQTAALAKLAQWPRRLAYIYDAIVIRRFERNVCNSARLVLVTTPREVTALKSLGVRSAVKAFMHKLQVSFIPDPNFDDSFVMDEGLNLVFHGKLSYVANQLALNDIAKIILPRLDSSFVKVNVVGKYTLSDVRKFPTIKFHGFVSDLSESLSQFDLALCPMRVSVGISNKALEALACGLPVLITKNVADGLPLLEYGLGRCIFVEEISEFPDFIAWFRQMPRHRRMQTRKFAHEYTHRLLECCGDKGTLEDLITQ